MKKIPYWVCFALTALSLASCAAGPKTACKRGPEDGQCGSVFTMSATTQNINSMQQ